MQFLSRTYRYYERYISLANNMLYGTVLITSKLSSLRFFQVESYVGAFKFDVVIFQPVHIVNV